MTHPAYAGCTPNCCPKRPVTRTKSRYVVYGIVEPAPKDFVVLMCDAGMFLVTEKEYWAARGAFRVNPKRHVRYQSKNFIGTMFPGSLEGM